MSLLIIILVNLIVYWRTLFYGYVSDDIVVSQKNEPKVRDFWHGLWLQFWGHRYLNCKHAHIMTLGVHIINCLLIYALLHKTPIALPASLLFAINPVNMQGGSIWLSGRAYSFATTFTLIIFNLPVLTPILYFVVPHLAPSGFFIPAGFIGTKWWFWSFLIPIFMKWGAMGKIVHNKIYNQPNKTVNTEMTSVKPKKLIILIKTFGYYFTLCLIPFKIGLYHKFLYGFGTNQTDNKKGYKLSLSFWYGLSIMVGILLHMIFIHNLATWGLIWFSVNIVMWCNLKTIQQQIAERYLYLPCIGLMIFLSQTIGNYWLILFAIYLTRLWFVMPSYISDYWIVEYNLAEFKSLHYPWLMRGVKKFTFGDFRSAYHDFCEAHIHKPYDFKVLFNLSCTCLMLGDFGNARKFFDEAKKNRYDEIEEDTRMLFEELESQILNAEKESKSGQYKIDLSKVRVVK